MSEVKIAISNIQTHENTDMVFKDGIVVISSKGNNVGKSTIFRCLKAICEVTRYSKEDITSLIRTGTNHGIIHFEYDNSITELHLYKNADRAYYSFLHLDDKSNKDVVQLTRAPKSLLKALGLFYNEDLNEVVNIIEADKFQPFVDEGEINSAILSSVFFDPKIEEIKEKITDIQSFLNTKQTIHEHEYTIQKRKIQTLRYMPEVERFKKDRAILEILSKVSDTVHNPDALCEYDNTMEQLNRVNSILDIYKKCQTILHNINSLYELKEIDIPLAELFLKCMFNIKELYGNMASLHRSNNIDIDHLNTLLKFRRLLSKIAFAYTTSDALYQLNQKHIYLINKILSSEQVVMCPIKGRVIYNEKACISIDN